MSVSTESPLAARVSRAELVARELEREIASGLEAGDAAHRDPRRGTHHEHADVVLGFKTGSTSYEECLELREALEPLIDSRAARYHRARDIRELKRIVNSMHAAVDDPAAFFKCNWTLHRRIAELCRNRPLRGMYLALIDFLEFSIDRAAFSSFDGAAIEAHRPRAAPVRLASRRMPNSASG